MLETKSVKQTKPGIPGFVCLTGVSLASFSIPDNGIGQENDTKIKVDFEADFAPFQTGQQKAVKGVKTLKASYKDDSLAGNDPVSGETQMDTSKDKNQGHSIFRLMDDIKNLPAGNYKIVYSKIVKNKQ